MKKVLAVFLAVLMAFSFVTMTAFAKVENSETIVDELLNGEYSHVDYVVNKKYFKTELGLYTGFSLYDNAWDNLFTGSVDVGNAKTILLALIERFEAEYNNETYEQIIDVLKAAKDIAGVVEKVDEYTGIIGLAENAEWAQSLAAVNAAIKIMNLSNDLYEQYVEAYAVILSCQAASVYYGDLLDYISANVDDENVQTAAEELKANITKSLEEQRDALIAELAESVAKEGASMGISAALSSNTVTTVISTVYGAVGTIGKKVFNTDKQYNCMSTLAMLVKIEDVMPAYVSNVLLGEDDLEKDFAVCSILTMRELGETTLANLAKAKTDSWAGKVIDTSNQLKVIDNAALAAAKLTVYGKLIKADETYTIVKVYKSIDESSTKQNKVTLKDADGVVLAVLSAGKSYDFADSNAYYYCAKSEVADKNVQVIVTFVEGTECSSTTVTTSSSSGSSSSSSNKGGIAGFFQSIIDAIINAFKNLFKK